MLKNCAESGWGGRIFVKNAKVICRECEKTMVQGRKPENQVNIVKSICAECRRGIEREKARRGKSNE